MDNHNKKKKLILIPVLIVILLIIAGLVFFLVNYIRKEKEDDYASKRNDEKEIVLDKDEDKDIEEAKKEDESEAFVEINPEGINLPIAGESEEFDDSFSQYSDTENELIEAAGKYSGASINEIDGVDGDVYTIHCYDIVDDHTATTDWLYIDITTFSGTNFFGDEVDLNDYLLEADDSDCERNDCIYTATVSASDGYVNLRTGAGTSFNIIREITNDNILIATEESADGKWIRVRFEDDEGWVAVSQVTINK